MKQLSSIELFFGIGGIGLGFHNAGIKTVVAVEKDEKCQMVIRRHFPEAKLFNDVRTFGRKDYDRTVDIIAGGFPCQDVSIAGKRKGLAGERSGLYFEFHRIITEYMPGIVVLENVPGLLSARSGQDLAVVIGGLTGIIPEVPENGWGNAGLFRGPVYNVAYRVLDAQYTGVAQRRRRVLIVGTLAGSRRNCAEILFEREGMSGNIDQIRATRKVAPTLPASGAGTSRAGGQGNEPEFYVPVAFQQNERDEVRLTSGDGQIAGALAAEPGVKQQNYIINLANSGANQNNVKKSDVADTLDTWGAQAVVEMQDTIGALQARDRTPGTTIDDKLIAFSAGMGAKAGSIGAQEEISPTLKGSEGGNAVPAIAWKEAAGSGGRGFLGNEDSAFALSSYQQRVGVRRLTPTETCRLQGLPDDWNEWGLDEKGKRVNLSDSARYRQTGNAVCRNVAEWLGRRIVKFAGS